MELSQFQSGGNMQRTESTSTTATLNRIAARNSSNFVSTMDEWVEIYGNAKIPLKDKVFDVHCLQRSNDRSTSVAGLTDGRTCEQLVATGCLTVPVSIDAYNATDKNGSPAQSVRYVNFMLNFRALWDHYEAENIDQVTDYCPLFRLYVELFFHKHTVLLMIFISIYYFAAMVTCDSIYVTSTPAARAVYYFATCLQTFVYLALVVLLKGSLFPAKPATINGEPDISEVTKENDSSYWRSKQSLSCLQYFREAVTQSIGEVTYYLQRVSGGQGSAANTNRETQRTVAFYETINNGLKFLTKHSMQGGNKLKLDRPVHNFKLLFIFFAIPVYMLITTYLSPYGPLQNDIKICNSNGWDSPLCKNISTLFVVTLGYSIPLLLKIIFISSVLLSLVGLSLGAEIGCALMDSWILRFGSLRTLKVNAGESADVEEGGNPAEKASSASAPRAPKPAATSIRAVSAAAHPDNAVHNALLPSSVYAATAAPQFAPGWTVSAQSPEVLIYLQRDAYEHYLYVREYMNNASKAWSFTIIALGFTGLYFIVMFAFGALSNPALLTVLSLAFYSCWVTIRVCILTIYPIMALARANAYVYALQEQFLVAAPEDFAVIGGRDSWLEYLDKVPAMWTIYGLTITWDRLSGVLWTGVAGVGAIAISSIASSA